MRRSEPPASVPDLLPPPPVPSGAVLGHPSGWECPRCHRVYAPWVACCGTCGPEDASGRTEITEN